MSSRRKGKPQQRKKIETVEPDQDFVTCGDCQREFLLSDFVKYIQHKVNRCNKENVEPFDGHEFDEDADPEATPSVITTQRTSISAPIQQEKHSPRPSIPSVSQDDDLSRLEKVDQAPEERSSTSRGADNNRCKPRLVDAESNTEQEPSSFQCSTCKTHFKSSWVLVQHVQSRHGIRIYEEKAPERRSPPGMVPPAPDKPDNKDRILSEPKAEPCNDRPSSSSTSSSASAHSKLQQQNQKSPSNQTSPGGPTMFPSPPFPMPTTRQQMTPPFGPGMPPFARPPHVTQDAFNSLMSEFSSQNSPFGRRMPYLPDMQHMLPGFPLGNMTDSMTRESMMAIYSNRLRELASHGTPGSPSSSPSARKHNSHPYLEERRPNETNGSVFNNTPTSQPQSMDARNSMLPPKLKACEFCDKKFRFQSNLIVHRRSHTGEKPYKCPVCPHSCTQASKLKRHMKIHTKSLFGMSRPDSRRSSTSTPDSKFSKMDDYMNDDGDESDEDEEELDEEAAEAREREAEESLKIIEQQVRRAQLQAKRDKGNDNGSAKDDEPTDLSRSKSVDSDGRSTPAKTPNSKSESENPADLSIPPDARAALLNEVMENIGLASNPLYKEAYDRALKESTKRGRSVSPKFDDIDRKDITENGLENSPRDSSRSTPSSSKRDSPTSSHRLDYSPDRDAGSRERAAKRVKSEPSESQAPMGPHPSFPTLDPFYQPHRDSLYPPAFPWFPPGPRDFMGLPRETMHLPFRFENGMPTRESAMKSSMDNGPKPRMAHPGLGLPRQVMPTVTSPNGPPSGGIPGVPVRRRNDTCEFCGKIFKNCSNLTVHRRSHTGEKPYKCELCSYACAQSSKLTRHMKTHGRLGKDVYRCKFCSMPFSVPSTLEKHMRKCVENQQNRSLPSTMNTDTTGSTSSVSSNVSVSSPVMQSPVESMHSIQSPVELQSPDSLPVMHS